MVAKGIMKNGRIERIMVRKRMRMVRMKTEMTTKRNKRRQMMGRMKRRLNYLDDADLLEELSHFVSCDVFAQSFHEDGVVVRVVLLP